MASHPRAQARFGQRTLFFMTVAPLTGWVVHASALHKRLAATRQDHLTGLLRREAYTARARRLLTRGGDGMAVIMVDVDHFKAVNDSVGHAAGDGVLAAFGARLTAWAGPRAALYEGKHTGRAVLAAAKHATLPSINGRRAGRPGTAMWGRAA